MRISEELLKACMEVAPAVLLAMLGGMVRMMQNPKAFSWCWFFGGLLMSAFVGILVFLLIADAEAVSPNFRAAVCGVSGYSSAQILGLLEKKVLRAVAERGK